MKKKIVIMCLIALCMTGCSDADNEGKVDAVLGLYNYKSGISDQWDGENYINPNGLYGESANGFFVYDAFSGKMMFYNKEEGVAIPLCSKVQCEHYIPQNFQPEGTGEYIYECDASYDRNIGCQVYNGKLYADYTQFGGEGRRILLRVNLDGTGKTEIIHNLDERLKRLEEESKDISGFTSQSNSRWIISDDKIYLITAMKVGRAVDSATDIYIDVYDINTGELTQELFYEKYVEGDAAFVSFCEIMGDKIILGLHVETETLSGEIQSDRRFYTIDMSNGNKEEISIDKSEYGACDIYADGLIYQKKGGDIYTINPAEERTLRIELTDQERERGVYVKCVGDYIFLSLKDNLENPSSDDQFYVKVYDMDFNYVDTIITPERLIVRAGHNQILLESNNQFGKYYYADASMLGTGNVEVKEYTVK